MSLWKVSKMLYSTRRCEDGSLPSWMQWLTCKWRKLNNNHWIIYSRKLSSFFLKLLFDEYLCKHKDSFVPSCCGAVSNLLRRLFRNTTAISFKSPRSLDLRWTRTFVVIEYSGLDLETYFSLHSSLNFNFWVFLDVSKVSFSSKRTSPQRFFMLQPSLLLTGKILLKFTSHLFQQPLLF